jgi:uncharacterized membrane protein YqaE (UPF0057 family)
VEDGKNGDEAKLKELNIVAIILAVVLPPLGVLFKRGANRQLAINVVLTLLGWLPGVLHAIYVILRSGQIKKP